MQPQDLTVRLDRVLAENTALRGQIQILVRQGERIMSTQDDILTALSNSKDATTKARTAISALEAENADLKAKLATATKQAGETVDTTAVAAAINDANASAKALTDAIPAGSDQVVIVPGSAAPSPATMTATADVAVKSDQPSSDPAIGTVTLKR